MKKKIAKKINKIIGKKNIYTDLEERLCYSYDATNLKYLPDLVVFPGSAQEISQLVRLAIEKKFPLIPRGAGSGFSGGALPVEGGTILGMNKLNRILDIEEENLTALVEPGVITGDFQKEVEERGLFYPPDPASLEFSTLGGNVAECAGGPRAFKYGVTKDYVLGLEVVLPTGEIIHTGVKTIKGVVGYDLTKLLVGSEGTLGIITKIILKLLPLPETKKTVLAIFSKMEEATEAISQIISSRIIPATLEFMDQSSIVCVEDYLNLGLPTQAEAFLLMEVDGEEGGVNKQINKIKELLSGGRGVIEIEVAKDKEEEEKLWKARRSISPALLKLNPTKINEDIAVPRNKVPQIINKIQEIAQRLNLKIVNFGHAGDGNIHVNIMIDGEKLEEVKKSEEAVKEIFRATLDLGGTISGEHGIGITKAPYLKMELNELGIEVMKKIKEIFDPHNILNPGKIFPTSSFKPGQKK